MSCRVVTYSHGLLSLMYEKSWFRYDFHRTNITGGAGPTRHPYAMPSNITHSSLYLLDIRHLLL